MKRILKYTLGLTDKQVVEIQGDTILSVREQNNQIVVYAIGDNECKPRKYLFEVIGTGDLFDYDRDELFLGTVQLRVLVFHIFYKELVGR